MPRTTTAPASPHDTPAARSVLTRRQALATGAAALGAVAWGLPRLARAQGDGKPLRVILPLSPGAGGITGTTQIVRAPKDGSVIGVVSNNHVVNPSVYKNIPFDSLADITPITIIGATPFVLVAHPSVPVKTVQELIALARAKPGVLNYGSSGNGTILHLAPAMFVGQVQLAVVAVAPAAAHIKSGALRALGVTTASRVPSLPGVPTIAEQGLPGYELDGWIAPVGPAGLPKAELQRLYAAFKAAMEMPEARDALIAQGYEIKLTPPEPAAAFFRSEVARMAQVVKNANVTMD